MCGIAGAWDRDGGTPDVAPMLRRIAHRGPDGEGTEQVAPGLVLGHRRLAILDLSPTGDQPMRSSSGRYTLVFNGEVYNFRSLRARLEAEGRRFRGSSDTEVLLEAVEQWGLEPALAACAGMFAFALHDAREGVLHLVRDRLGKKPLAYAQTSSGFRFASEVTSFEADGGAGPGPGSGPTGRLDRDAVALHCGLGCIPAPWTVWEGVRKLPPGHLLTVRDGRVEGPPRPYWDLARVVAEARAAPAPADPEARADGLERLLETCVRERLESDVPLGAFLSGGIDSSLVVALAQRHTEQPLRTFSIGFEDADYDEAVHARRVAEHLGCDHHEQYVSADDALRVVAELPRIYDEPFADSSQIPTLLVSRLARRHVTVALSGDGGDELFGGYNRYALGGALWSRSRRLPRPARRLAARAAVAVPETVLDALAGAAGLVSRRARLPAAGQKAHKFARALQADDASALHTAFLDAWYPEPPPVRANVDAGAYVRSHRPPPELDVVEGMMYTDTLTYLPEDILVKVDRATMSVGLEARAPLLDHRLLEYAWSLPREDRIQDGRGKVILRRVLHRHVPAEMVERPKMGFGFPVGQWLRGPLRDWADDLLDPARLRETGVLDVDRVQRTWRTHLRGRRDLQARLWPVLMFEEWRRSRGMGRR